MPTTPAPQQEVRENFHGFVAKRAFAAPAKVVLVAVVLVALAVKTRTRLQTSAGLLMDQLQLEHQLQLQLMDQLQLQHQILETAARRSSTKRGYTLKSCQCPTPPHPSSCLSL